MNDPLHPNVPPGANDHPLLATPADVLVNQVRDLVLWSWRLRWWLLGSLLVGSLLGIGMARTLLNKQMAIARVSLLRSQLENPLGSFNRKSIRFFNAPLSAFTADSLVESTLRRLDGVAPSPRLLLEVQQSLRIIDYGNDDYEVSYSHLDGNRAVKLLTLHIQSYLDSEVERNLAALRREIARLEISKADLAQRMTNADRQVREFRAANAFVRLEYAKENMSELRQSQRTLTDLESRLADTKIELEEARRRLAAESPEIRVATTTSSLGDAERVARIDRLRMEISTLRADGMLDQHPVLARLLTEEHALTRMDNPVAGVPTETSEEIRPNERYLQLTQTVDKLRVAEAQLQRQINATTTWRDDSERIINALPALEERYAELTRNQDVDRKSYESIIGVLQLAQLQLRLEEAAASSRLDVYSAPRLRFSSNLVRMVAFGLAGAMAGVSLVIAAWGGLRLRRLVWNGNFSHGRVG